MGWKGEGVHMRKECWVLHKDRLSALGMGQRVKRGHNRRTAIELGMRLGIGGQEGEVKVCSWPSCFPVWRGLWLPRECLLELGAGIKL